MAGTKQRRDIYLGRETGKVQKVDEINIIVYRYNSFTLLPSSHSLPTLFPFPLNLEKERKIERVEN